MRIFILITSFFSCFAAISQDDTAMVVVKKSSLKRHQVELSPVSVWVNKGFFVGHRLKYQFQLKPSMRIELESNGTIFRSLDRHARNLKEDKVFPLLNQTTGIFSMNLIGRGKTINRNKQKRYVSSLRLGYHFFQHSTPYWNSEYWAYDSTVQTGVSSIRSFQSHSISLGLGFRSSKHKRLDGTMAQVASHKWSLDYLGNVHYQLSSYSQNDANDYDIKDIPNTYGLRKSGARFTYNYTRYLNSNFGIHFGVEALYVPFLDNYKPLEGGYFVPRGGERMIPVFGNMHVGVSFVF